MKRIDLVGQKFGKLIVVEYSHTKKPRGTAFFLCKCECGNTLTVASGHLRDGHTQSCGCLQIEMAKTNSLGNTWGRKYDDPKTLSANHVWEVSYSDGCSFETFIKLSQEPCHYCGALPSNRYNKYLTKDGQLTNKAVSINWAEKAYFVYNGLDRIDSSRNHSEDNVVPCCFQCNRAKDDRTIEEFEAWIIKIYKHLQNKKSQ